MRFHGGQPLRLLQYELGDDQSVVLIKDEVYSKQTDLAE